MAMTPFLFAILLQTSGPGDAAAIIRDAQRAFMTRTDSRVATRWQAALARAPRDRRALFANATIERMYYRYERSDSLYRRVLQSATVDQYSAAARLGLALWRSLGSDIPAADSLLSQARTEALSVGETHLAFDAMMTLSGIRG